MGAPSWSFGGKPIDPQSVSTSPSPHKLPLLLLKKKRGRPRTFLRTFKIDMGGSSSKEIVAAQSQVRSLTAELQVGWVDCLCAWPCVAVRRVAPRVLR